MTFSIQKTHLVSIVLIGSVIGYPLVAGISAAVDFDNRTASIVLRALVLGVSLWLLLVGKSAPSRLAVFAFLGFWSLYLTRLAYTFLIAKEKASIPAWEFGLWSVAICFIPALAVFFARDRSINLTGNMIILLVGLFAALLVLGFGGTSFVTNEGAIGDQNRWNVSGLNPISLGHLGATLFLAAAGTALSGMASRRQIMIALGVGVIGLIVVFLANSRGPMVAAALALLVLGLSRIRDRRTWLYAGLALIAGLGVVSQRAELIFGRGGLFDRFMGMVTGQDRSGEIRMQIFDASIQQFLDSPFLGDGVETRLFAYYPHNVVLEAFMTTGIFGGALFLLIIGLSLLGAWRLFKNRRDKIWLGLLLIQYVVAAQLSGAIYQTNAMWVLMASTMALAFRANVSNDASGRYHRSMGQVGQPLSAAH